MNTSDINHSGIGMTSQRTRMRMVDRLRQQGIRDEIVLSVMGEVPRHLFVDEALASRAYDDVSLPIGFGQTISNPYTVARMTELARARGDQGDLNKVLEIGTGCGYQCAVLARVAKTVHSVERLVQLTARARKHLRAARVLNARLRHGDGHAGMPTEAPFDVILMTAATTHVHKALLEQLTVGGRMIFPMAKGDEQHLWVIERTTQGYTEKRMDAVKFVPLLPGTA
jgi:protein-L-isoaspartate(D-aspartate) O-methyltransferase